MLRWLEHSNADIWEFLTDIALNRAEGVLWGLDFCMHIFWPQNLGLRVHIHKHLHISTYRFLNTHDSLLRSVKDCSLPSLNFSFGWQYLRKLFNVNPVRSWKIRQVSENFRESPESPRTSTGNAYILWIGLSYTMTYYIIPWKRI